MENYEIQEWNERYGAYGRDCLFVSRLRQLGLTDEQLIGVLDTLDGICLDCFDNDVECSCC